MKGFEAGLSVRTASSRVIEGLSSSSIGFAEIHYFADKALEEQAKDYLEYRKRGGDAVSVWSVHTPFGGWEWDIACLDTTERKKIVNTLEPSFKLARLTGARVVVVHPGLEIPLNVEKRQERLDACRESIREMAERFSDSNTKLAVEFLPRTCLGNSAEELLYLIDGCDPSSTGICLDINHVIPTSRLSSTIRTLGSRIITLHVSDHDDIDERHRFPMEGVTDWKAALRLLADVGYAGPFMYEVTLKWTEPDADIEADIKKIRANYDALPW